MTTLINSVIYPELQASNPMEKVGMTVGAVALAVAPVGGEEAAATRVEKTVIHHIASDKNKVGGFTKAFEAIFEKAGMTLDHEPIRCRLAMPCITQVIRRLTTNWY